MSYVKPLIGRLGCEYNQIYEPSHVYNQNKDRVYNEIYIEN